jgi:ABC-2 type transport system ATP-binding protein
VSIEVKEVYKYYGEQAALKNVNFSIKSGEIVGFLGPNGAGKSTMMKILTCYLQKSEGEVKVNGLNVDTDSLEIKKIVGYLPEHNPLYLEMYIKEYLTYVANIYKLKNVKQRVAEMIEMVGLQKEQHKKIGALSKGYRQRVGLAQAIIHDPEVLILDEPTTGLDPNQLVEIRQLIQNIGETKTVMLSTHIMQEVEAICDRVIIIKDGEIVADDSTKHIQQQQTDLLTIFVEFDTVVSKNQLQNINGVKTAKLVEDNKWVISSAKDVRAHVAKFAQQNDMLILTIRLEEKSMEEVFKDLTNR